MSKRESPALICCAIVQIFVRRLLDGCHVVACTQSRFANFVQLSAMRVPPIVQSSKIIIVTLVLRLADNALMNAVTCRHNKQNRQVTEWVARLFCCITKFCCLRFAPIYLLKALWFNAGATTKLNTKLPNARGKNCGTTIYSKVTI